MTTLLQILVIWLLLSVLLGITLGPWLATDD